MIFLPRASLAARGAAPTDDPSREDPRRSRATLLLALVFALALSTLLPAAASAQTATAGQLVIS